MFKEWRKKTIKIKERIFSFFLITNYYVGILGMKFKTKNFKWTRENKDGLNQMKVFKIPKEDERFIEFA